MNIYLNDTLPQCRACILKCILSPLPSPLFIILLLTFLPTSSSVAHVSGSAPPAARPPAHLTPRLARPAHNRALAH